MFGEIDDKSRPNVVPRPQILLTRAALSALLLGRLLPVPIPASPEFKILGWLTFAIGFALDTSAILVMHRACTNILPRRAANSLVVRRPF